MNQSELSATLSIALLYIVRMLGLFMVLPVLPLLVDSIDAATPFLLGLALGAYGLSQASLQIPMGMWSDRFGRKRIIAIGLLMFITGSLVAGFSDNIYGIIVGRFLQGCGAIASSLLALLGDVTRMQNRSKAMAVVGMSIGASFGIALILGPYINSHWGISGVFLTTAALGSLGLLVLLGVPDTKIASSVPALPMKLSLVKDVLKDGGIMRATLGVFLLHYMLMSGFVVFPLLLLGTANIPAAEHSQYYFYMLASTFIFMGPFMWLSDKKGYARAMAFCMILVLIGANLVLAISQSFMAVMVGLVLFFMAFNLLEVIFPSMVSKLAPAGSRGSAMGVYSTAQFAGAFVGGAIGGYVLGGWDIAYLLYANAAICLVWVGLSIGLPASKNVSTLVFSYTGSKEQSAQEILNAVLSVAGVIEAVIVEADEIAYLKVDNNLLDTQTLNTMGHIAA